MQDSFDPPTICYYYKSQIQNDKCKQQIPILTIQQMKHHVKTRGFLAPQQSFLVSWLFSAIPILILKFLTFFITLV